MIPFALRQPKVSHLTLQPTRKFEMSTSRNGEDAGNTHSGHLPSSSLGLSPAPETKAVAPGNPIVVGLYGISGSGKTFLLNQLKKELGAERFEYYDGSGMIVSVVPDGLASFQEMTDEEQTQYRRLAIDSIKESCVKSGKIAIVAGHFMLCSERDEASVQVWTESDRQTFTHICYLNVPVEEVRQQSLNDKERCRPDYSSSHLQLWQSAEKTELESVCRNNGILFSLLNPQSPLLDQALTLLRGFQYQTENENQIRAQIKLDEALGSSLN